MSRAEDIFFRRTDHATARCLDCDWSNHRYIAPGMPTHDRLQDQRGRIRAHVRETGHTVKLTHIREEAITHHRPLAPAALREALQVGLDKLKELTS